jgi:hypothetical protein
MSGGEPEPSAAGIAHVDPEVAEPRYDARPRALRGVIIGLLFSMPLWLGLAWLIRSLTGHR